jgi:hypothetical protein
MIRGFQRPGWTAVIVTLLALCAWGAPGASASAGTPGVGWEVTGHTYPTNLPPGGKGLIEIDVFNVGAASSNGTITVTDILPEGLTATEAGELQFPLPEHPLLHSMWECTGNGPGGAVAGATIVNCMNGPELPSFAGGGGVTEPGFEGFNNKTPQIGIEVNVSPTQGTGINSVTIGGGGASTSASTTNAVTVSSVPAAFGFAGFDGWFSNADGTLDTQAGSHPYELTTSFDLNSIFTGGEMSPVGGEIRDVEVLVPPGLVGNPTAVPQCTRQELNEHVCPNASQVGTAIVTFLGGGYLPERIFNMVPPAGVPAEFAFEITSVQTILDSAVRSGSDYGITVRSNNIAQRKIIKVVTSLWGVPGDPSHVIWRTAASGGCSQAQIEALHPGDLQLEQECKPVGVPPKPFLTLPTSCAAPPVFTIRATSWEHPDARPIEDKFQVHDSNHDPTGMTGCEDLVFAPTLTTAPDTSKADTPTGLTVEVKPPAGGLADVGGLSPSDIQNTTVALPEGMAINPGQAAGLLACPETEATLKESDEAPSCPNASKVGTDEIVTPLLAKPLQGNVYILQSNPPELKLLVAASGEGVNLKLVGTVHLNQATGQLVTTFAGTPELPFTDFKLSFSGGAQAALATPTACGTYTASSDFNPWSSPFVADAFPTASFRIESGTNGAPCPPSPLPFSPNLIAGSTTDQAGGYTDFSLLLQAPDDQQRIEKLQFKTPEGLLGMISKVPLCGEPQAAQGTCPAASQIGHTVVASGPGPYPLVVPQPGQPPAPIYLTGSYQGAPYGLSIVVPLHVGPFVLPTQIVRAKIEVDRHTSQLTVTTDPLPQFVGGVPTDLRSINAVIDRPGFMFNPTDCNPMSFSGTAFGTQGASAPISSAFQMGSCRSLLFKPDFKASTSGRTSRANGASLDVKVLYPTGDLGANQASSQSNIASVKVELPKKLPSRLTTLQKACTAAQFDANPAGCPAASIVGHATAVTPVLPVPLMGPAYFVSNGNESFPNLIIVLQGYGVTIDLVGDTFISKAGITSSTFKQIPDVPIASFELTLPEGPFSALAANGNLCKSTLKMPTDFVAQNGAVLDQATKISVTGCPKAKSKQKARHHKHPKRKARRGKQRRK